jgi:flagellar hook assembly protein FlgD
MQIGVYNAAGRRIRNLASGVQSIGRHEVVWDGTADDGSRVQHGVYFVRIVVGGEQRNMRLIYLR